MGADEAVVILGDFLDLPLPVFDFDLALTTLRTTAATALELLVGVNGHDQQSVDFGRLKSLVALEGLIGADQHLAPILQPIAFGHVNHPIIGDGPVSDEPLPAAAGAFELQLQEGRLAQHGTQQGRRAHREGGHPRAGAVITHPAQTTGQIKDFSCGLPELAQSVHESEPPSGSPRRNSSVLICESSSRPS